MEAEEEDLKCITEVPGWLISLTNWSLATHSAPSLPPSPGSQTFPTVMNELLGNAEM